MKVRFTEKFYNKKMIGKTKELPIRIANPLIKTGEVVEVKSRNTKK
jgi:hypothetical protein